MADPNANKTTQPGMQNTLWNWFKKSPFGSYLPK